MNYYTPKYNRDSVNENSHKRVSRKKNHSQKFNKKRLFLLSYVVTFTLALIIIITFILLPKDNLEVVEGTWVYDEYTKYIFDGKGKGCLCLENMHYKYTYKICDNVLNIDFQENTLQDCVYHFNVRDHILTIIGGEGTVGGIYELTKE